MNGEDSLRVVAPAKYEGLVGPSLDSLNRALGERAAKFREGGEVLICEAPKGSNEWRPFRAVDGWQMRADFLRTKRNTTSLLQFLNEYGEWDVVATAPYFDQESKQWKPKVIVPEQIWYDLDLRQGQQKSIVHLQDVISWGLTCKPEEWFSSMYGRVSVVGPQPTFPHFSIDDYDCERVMLSAVTIDRLRGTKFRLCARKDCKTPFAVESKRKRIYCCWNCGHVESSRRNRKPTRKEKHNDARSL